MGTRTYFDCAEDDCRGFLKCYETGNIYNSLGSMAQNICEKYMKHVIEECYQPATPEESKRKTTILRTHSLASLTYFLASDLNITYPADCVDAMELIDGWYITTKYPGEDAVELNEGDIKDCVKAVKDCRSATIDVCKIHGLSFNLLLPEEQTKESEVNQQVDFPDCKERTFEETETQEEYRQVTKGSLSPEEQQPEAGEKEAVTYCRKPIHRR